MRKVIKGDLSTQGIRKIQEELEKYKNDVIYKTRLLAETLAEKGVEIARVRVADLDAIFTGELIQSIHTEYKGSVPNGATFMLVADSDHAIYVEMGTGTIGASSPYPGKIPVVYAQGKHFVTLSRPFGKYPAGTYGWFYYKDGQLYFTQGMPSRPFMYQTSLELMRIVEKTAREVFKG